MIMKGFGHDINNENFRPSLMKSAFYFTFDVCLQWFNIAQNIGPNHFWANENWFLLFNTGVSLFQGLTSFLLVAEFPTYMHLMKPIRAFSMGLASVYNILYIFIFMELWTDVTDANNYHNHYTISGYILDMFYSFGLLMHLPIWMLNSVIFLREIKIENDKAYK